MKHQVYYASFYGSTRQYAEALADRLGTVATELPALVEPTTEPLIILSPIHGPNHAGAKFIKEIPQEVFEARRICLATVGMTLDHIVEAQDPAKSLLGKRADSVKRFYLPGRMNYSELTPSHRKIMRGLISMLKMKPGKSANEQMMIDTYGKDIDRVDLARLEPIVEWALEL